MVKHKIYAEIAGKRDLLRLELVKSSQYVKCYCRKSSFAIELFCGFMRILFEKEKGILN